MYMINLDKKDLKWLQKALNKKDIRWFCNQILVKDGFAYATNGHVLHKIKCSEGELNGYYDFNGVKLENNDQLHPLEKNSDRMFEGFIDHNIVLNIMFGRLDCLQLNSSIGINKTYFENVIDKTNEIAIRTNEDRDRINIQYSNRECIIMGMRL